MSEIEHFMFVLVGIILLSLLTFFCFELSRKTDYMTSEIKAMRHDMIEAGYMPEEPKITEIKK